MSLATAQLSVDAAIERVSATATALDRNPRFPAESLDALAAAGLLGITVPAAGERRPLARSA